MHIPSRQSTEEDHAQTTNDEVEHRAAKEHIDQSGNDQANKRHDQETTYRGQVLLGRIANQGHGAKHTCRDKESQGYGSRSIDGEEDAHRHTIEDGEGDEAHGSRSDRDTAEAGRQPDDQSDLGCKQHEHGHLGTEETHQEARAVADTIGDDSRDGQGQSHPGIDLPHEERHDT